MMGMTVHRGGLCCLVAVLLIAAATAVPARAADAPGAMTLATGGHTDYRIAIGPGAAPVVRDAAQALADYLGRISGARFTLTEGAGDGPIIRIESQAVRRREPGGAEGFTIRTRGANLLISGESPRAAAYGVYYFLERYLGVRWLASDFTVVPRHETLVLGAIDVREQPRFSYREVFSRDADDPGYDLHNRLNGQFGHRIIEHKLGAAQGGSVDVRHMSIFALVSRKTYARKHHEYFGGGQLRFANPHVREIALATLKKKLAKWPSDKSYYLLVAHADRDTYYNGGRDAEIIHSAGAPGAAYVDFMRYLADGIRKDYPNVTLLVEAYLWSRKPPRGMALPDNLGVMLADIEVNFAKPLEAPQNRPFLDDLDGWSQLTDQVIIWHYITDFSSYLQPFPNLSVLADDVRTLAQYPAVKGIFEQGSYSSKGGELALLRAWVLSKLLWSPQRDGDALIREFCDGYFGPAAPYILKYIAALDESARLHQTDLSTKTPPTAAYLSMDFLRTADSLFAEAVAAVAGQQTYLKHVQIARMAVDYAILINRPRLIYQARQSGQAWPVDHERLDRLARAMKQAGMTHYREGGGSSSKDLIKALSIARTMAPPPQICAQVSGDRHCNTVQDLAFALAGSAHLVADPGASDGAAATMKGTDMTWGIQIPLERLIPGPGSWKLYVQARVDPGNAKPDAGALQVGVYPGQHQTTRLSQLADGQYHSIPVPGVWTRDATRNVWIAPGASKAVAAIYVDRVVAVPAQE